MASLQIRFPGSHPLAPNLSSHTTTIARFKSFNKPLAASPNSDLPLDGDDNLDPVKLAFARAEAYKRQKLQAQSQKLESSLSGNRGKSMVLENPSSYGTDSSSIRFRFILLSTQFFVGLVAIAVLKQGAKYQIHLPCNQLIFSNLLKCFLVIEI